ncbi:hypothetical protein [uncultured Streptomyces sp.]|uniref:hypothetical protein n=1 Tax=uncultured Streptomyces sp. TaxID=174707 RepID=UPI0026348620|nr:hypothetical protein [uncultured Streptomyces sp.]
MSLRHHAAAALSAFALIVALPHSASAATGQFRYSYETEEGYEAVGFLNSPRSGQCITLPAVDSDDVPPAHTPRNLTDAPVTVFLDADCEGEVSFTLRPGGGASERLKLRSVFFG